MATDKNAIGKIRIYNSAFQEKGREDVIKWDILPIVNGEEIRVTFESIASSWRQGLWLKTDKEIRVNEIKSKSVDLWQDTAPKEVHCECFTNDGNLSVYNIWDKGNGRESQSWTSGMLIEELPNGRRYRCNDIGFETNFDKIIFKIERI